MEKLEHYAKNNRRKQFTDEDLDYWLYIKLISRKMFLFDSY